MLQPNQPVFESLDPEITNTLLKSKREIDAGRSTSSTVAAGLAMASAPLAFAALARDAFAQAPTDVVGVLNFALTLEQLESAFYRAALNNVAFTIARGLLSNAAITAFQQISQHEDAHVAYLKQTITSLSGTPVVLADSVFDFTAGNGSGVGPFISATTDPAVLLALAQGFEDTGVRAYKGQAANLTSNPDVLTAALQIHSVEARHAAQIRRLRDIKGWITGDDSEITAPVGSTPNSGTAQQLVDSIYNGEDNTTQGGADLSSLGSGNGGTEAVQQAFDEPLTYDQVVAIVQDFIIGDAP
jgi:hypothetical protein